MDFCDFNPFLKTVKHVLYLYFTTPNPYSLVNLKICDNFSTYVQRMITLQCRSDPSTFLIIPLLVLHKMFFFIQLFKCIIVSVVGKDFRDDSEREIEMKIKGPPPLLKIT